MSNPKLHLRAPVKGESAFHYCAEIARNHGWATPDALLKACGKTPINNWFADSRDVIDAVKEHIKPYSNASLISSRGFEFSDLFFPELKICPLCIKEEKPHLSIHQLPYVTHCHVHNTVLINRCAECDSAVTSSVHSVCLTCSTDFLVAYDQSIPSYVSFARGQRDTLKVLESLLSVASLVGRLWDLITESINWRSLRNQDIVLAMTCAYDILLNGNENELRASFDEFHAKNKTWLDCVLSEKFREFQERVNNFHTVCNPKLAPSSTPYTNLNHISNVSKVFENALPKKRKVAVGGDATQLEQQCTGRQLIKAFGFDIQTLETLIQMGIFVPITATRVMNHALFCFSSTVERIQLALEPYEPNHDTNYVCFTLLSQEALAAYALTKGDLFLAIMQDKIVAKLATYPSLPSQLFIEKSSLLSFIKPRPILDEHVSIETAAKILCVPIQVVTKLIEMEFGLTYAKYQKAGPRLVDAESLKTFMRDYVLTDRLNWLHKIKKGELSEVLKIESLQSDDIYLPKGKRKQLSSFIRRSNCDPDGLTRIGARFPVRLVGNQRNTTCSQTNNSR